MAVIDKKSGFDDICAIAFEGRGDIAADKKGQAVDYLVRILLHVVFDPVEHKADQRVLIEVCDELFVVAADIHAFGALFNHPYHKIIGQLVEIGLYMLASDRAIDIHYEGLVCLDRLKDL